MRIDTPAIGFDGFREYSQILETGETAPGGENARWTRVVGIPWRALDLLDVG